MKSSRRKRTVSREVAAVELHLQTSRMGLNNIYRTIGRLAGRLPDDRGVRLIYRSYVADRLRLESHIESLERALKYLKEVGGQ